MCTRGRFVSAAVALALGAGVAGLAAGPSRSRQQPFTFRSAIVAVPVDVRVLDRTGQPVSDLKQDDFTILEDGVPQPIRHFSRYGLVAEVPVRVTRPLLRKVPSAELKAQNQRIFLIVLGHGRLQYPSGALTAAIRFVRERLLPQDQVAVLAFNRATDFTTDHATVASVLERYLEGHEQIDALMQQRYAPVTFAGGQSAPSLEAIYGSRGIPSAVQEIIDDVFQGVARITSRRLPPAGIEEGRRVQEDTDRASRALLDAQLERERQELGKGGNSLRAALDEAEGDAYTDLPFGIYIQNNIQAVQELQTLYAGIQYMRYLEGEKHLVLLTQYGLFLPRLENDKSLAAMANDARVVVDTIQTGGIWGGIQPTSSQSTPPIPGPSFTHTFSIMSLKNVSELTGGQSAAYTYTDRALERIDRTTRSGYLLGYYPSNLKWDGRYRRIEVKVNRPGVTVLYRHGYYGRDVVVPFDPEAFLSYSRIAAAGGYGAEIRDIPITLKATPVGAEGKTARAVFVELKIDLSRAGFVEEGGRQATTLDIAIFCADAKEALVGELWQSVNLNLKEETHQRLMREGLPYTAEVEVKSRPHWVKAVVYDRGADLVGSAIVRVR